MKAPKCVLCGHPVLPEMGMLTLPSGAAVHTECAIRFAAEKREK